MIDVIKFINGVRNEGTKDVFLNGYCYWFAFILNNRFPGGDIVYDPILGHFAYKYRGFIFDIRGIVPKLETKDFILWKDCEKLGYPIQSIIDGCILKVS